MPLLMGSIQSPRVARFGHTWRLIKSCTRRCVYVVCVTLYLSESGFGAKNTNDTKMGLSVLKCDGTQSAIYRKHGGGVERSGDH